MFEIRKITVNHMENPVGIGDLPRFSWIMESDRRQVMQTAYQLQIARRGGFDTPVYDSGKRETEASVQAEAEGFSMEELTAYQVRVKVWNNLGEESPWSRPAAFISALKGTDGWQASFISAENPDDRGRSAGTYIRGIFQVDKPVKEAFLVSTALGIYHPYLNGQPVGKDEMAPGWTVYGKRLLYQTYEVTSVLRKGENVLGAHLGAGWYKGSMGFDRIRNIYGETTAFSGQILIHYEDGTSGLVVTDGSFRGCGSPVLFSEIYDGEIYDARKEQPGWNAPGFDDGCWRPVRVVEQKTSVLVPQGGCKVKEQIPIPAKEIFVTPEGDTVIDFGQNLTGWVHVKIDGASGEEMVLNHFEVLDAQGNVYTDNLRSAKETLRYICSGNGPVIWRPSFTFQGFRYIRVASYPGQVKKENFTAWAVHSEMEDTGKFFCSNPLLNRLQHNISWGLKGNFLDIPTDCPQRDERLGWTGDAQIFCRTAAFLKNVYPFFSKWLQDLEADQGSDGAVPHVVPDILTRRGEEGWSMKNGTGGAAAWGDAAVIIPWTLYLCYGDTEIIRRQYNSMKAWVDFMRDHAEDSIWKYGNQYGDWVALDAAEGSYFGATPEELICTAYYAYSARLFAKMARAIDRMDDAEEYETASEAAADSYRRHFIRDGHLTARTQTAQILTLFFDLALPEDRPAVLRDLLDLLREQDGHLVTGFVGTPYFCHVLSRNGCEKEAYELLLKEDFPSWLYQVKMGATTVWEHWDGWKPDGSMWSPDMNSFNHYAYGAVGDWLYRTVAGIDVDEEMPGYKHIIFSPRIGGGLTEAGASYESVYGTVGCHWKVRGDLVEIVLQIPVNTWATLHLDSSIRLGPGEQELFGENGGRTARIGSGTWRIVCLRC